MPSALRKIGSFIWWVLRLGGIPGAVREIYQVLVYLAAYGPAFLLASVLTTVLDFAAQMPFLIRLAFFVGVFFCTLAIVGTLLTVVVGHLSTRKESKPNDVASQSHPVDTGSRQAQEASQRAERPLAPGPSHDVTSAAHPWATEDELSNSYIGGQSFYIFDLARRGFRIEGRTFEDCWIYGPAIAVVLGGTYVSEDCAWAVGADTASVLWEYQPTQKKILVGAIALNDCTIRNCTFVNVGFAVKPEDHKRLMQKGATENEAPS